MLQLHTWHHRKPPSPIHCLLPYQILTLKLHITCITFGPKSDSKQHWYLALHWETYTSVLTQVHFKLCSHAQFWEPSFCVHYHSFFGEKGGGEGGNSRPGVITRERQHLIKHRLHKLWTMAAQMSRIQKGEVWLCSLFKLCYPEDASKW